MQLPLKNSNRTMNLLTKTCLKNVPNIMGQDGKGDDAIVYLKFFIDSWTWLLTEIDQTTGEAFGMVYSSACPEGELGYFHLIELSTLRGSVGHGVERDKFWKKKPLKDCKNPCGG